NSRLGQSHGRKSADSPVIVASVQIVRQEASLIPRLVRASVLFVAGAAAMAIAQQPRPNPDSQYRLGPDSFPQEGVPKGEIRGPFVIQSQAYPGTQHTYWVYVPAQYDPAVPAA